MSYIYVIERLKKALDDQFLDEDSVLTLGNQMELIKIMIEDGKND